MEDTQLLQRLLAEQMTVADYVELAAVFIALFLAGSYLIEVFNEKM